MPPSCEHTQLTPAEAQMLLGRTCRLAGTCCSRGSAWPQGQPCSMQHRPLQPVPYQGCLSKRNPCSNYLGGGPRVALLSRPCSIICLLHCAVAVQRTATGTCSPKFCCGGDGLAGAVTCSAFCSKFGPKADCLSMWLRTALCRFPTAASEHTNIKGMRDRPVLPPQRQLRHSILKPPQVEPGWSGLCPYLSAGLPGRWPFACQRGVHTGLCCGCQCAPGLGRPE